MESPDLPIAAIGSSRKIWWVVAIALLGFCVNAPAQNASRGIEEKYVSVGEEQHSYYLYVPALKENSARLPVIVLMHGAGGNGLEQAEAWRPLSDSGKFIIIAPNIQNSVAAWDQLYDHPEWIRDAVDKVATGYPVDQRRIYLWGYSAGGMFAFYFAFMESRYFAAAAVHGGVIENFKYQMADFALRKVPFAYYIGTRDQWWSVAQAHATRDALMSRAFPMHYLELQGADHSFYAHSQEITRDAWKFMRRYSLDNDPQFDALDLTKIKAALK